MFQSYSASLTKLLAKLIVVGALTLNGILLHLVAFPMVTGNPKNPNKVAKIAAMGAVSTTSWLCASFVGAARHVAPYFSLYDFVILYLLVLALALLNERHLVQMCQVFRSERKLTFPQTRRSAEVMVYKTLWARLRLAVTRAVKLDG